MLSTTITKIRRAAKKRSGSVPAHDQHQLMDDDDESSVGASSSVSSSSPSPSSISSRSDVDSAAEVNHIASIAKRLRQQRQSNASNNTPRTSYTTHQTANDDDFDDSAVTDSDLESSNDEDDVYGFEDTPKVARLSSSRRMNIQRDLQQLDEQFDAAVDVAAVEDQPETAEQPSTTKSTKERVARKMVGLLLRTQSKSRLTTTTTNDNDNDNNVIDNRPYKDIIVEKSKLPKASTSTSPVLLEEEETLSTSVDSSKHHHRRRHRNLSSHSTKDDTSPTTSTDDDNDSPNTDHLRDRSVTTSRRPRLIKTISIRGSKAGTAFGRPRSFSPHRVLSKDKFAIHHHEDTLMKGPTRHHSNHGRTRPVLRRHRSMERLLHQSEHVRTSSGRQHKVTDVELQQKNKSANNDDKDTSKLRGRGSNTDRHDFAKSNHHEKDDEEGKDRRLAFSRRQQPSVRSRLIHDSSHHDGNKTKRAPLRRRRSGEDLVAVTRKAEKCTSGRKRASSSGRRPTRASSMVEIEDIKNLHLPTSVHCKKREASKGPPNRSTSVQSAASTSSTASFYDEDDEHDGANDDVNDNASQGSTCSGAPDTLLSLLNNERKSRGLLPLTHVPELSKTATSQVKREIQSSKRHATTRTAKHPGVLMRGQSVETIFSNNLASPSIAADLAFSPLFHECGESTLRDSLGELYACLLFRGDFQLACTY